MNVAGTEVPDPGAPKARQCVLGPAFDARKQDRALFGGIGTAAAQEAEAEVLTGEPHRLRGRKRVVVR